MDEKRAAAYLGVTVRASRGDVKRGLWTEAYALFSGATRYTLAFSGNESHELKGRMRKRPASSKDEEWPDIIGKKRGGKK